MKWTPHASRSLDDALAPWEGATSRRDFLKSSGLFVLGFGATGGVSFVAADSDRTETRRRIPNRTSTTSILGSSFMKMRRQFSMSERQMEGRVPGLPSVR